MKHLMLRHRDVSDQKVAKRLTDQPRERPELTLRSSPSSTARSAHVGFWHKADMTTPLREVRFRRQSRRISFHFKRVAPLHLLPIWKDDASVADALPVRR